MLPPEDVRCLPMEGVVEMRTGLGRLQNVTQHAVEVSTMNLVRCF